MVSVNLLPQSVLFARIRSQRIRRWAAVIGAAGALTAVPVGIDLVKTARGAALRREIEPMTKRLETMRIKLSELAAKQSELSSQITRADALRTKRDWSGLLRAITRSTPEEIWFTAIESRLTVTSSSEGRSRAAQRAGADAKTKEPLTLDGPRGLHISGYSISHESLYEFMSNLKAAELFSSVELNQADSEVVLETVAIRFTLTCDW